MEKYELIKQARELQKNKDLVNQFLILFDNSYFWSQVCYKSVIEHKLKRTSVLTAKLVKRVTRIQKGPPHLVHPPLVVPHLQATLLNLSLNQRAKKRRKSLSSWPRQRLEIKFNLLLWKIVNQSKSQEISWWIGSGILMTTSKRSLLDALLGLWTRVENIRCAKLSESKNCSKSMRLIDKLTVSTSSLNSSQIALILSVITSTAIKRLFVSKVKFKRPSA